MAANWLTISETIERMNKKRKKILIIDDDTAIIEALHSILESENDLVKSLTTIRTLTSLIKTSSPDLILLVLLLADSHVDGKQLTTRLKNDSETNHIPILVHSAHPRAEMAAKESAANGFLAKPFDIDVLLAAVKKYTEKNEII